MKFMIESAQMITPNPPIGNDAMHSHDNYEIYLFQEGKSDYLVEGNKYHLRKGDIMLMCRGELHINSIRSAITYRRSYINFDITEFLTELGMLSFLDMFDKRPLGEYNHYPAREFPDNHWQEYFQTICNTTVKEEKLCYLLPLLNELAKCFPELHTMTIFQAQNPVVGICKYINSDLTRDLSLDHLSEKFYLSKTHLNRLFKANVGTTVGQYIHLKRLFLAKELLAQGTPPKEVAFKCGFQDYTTFYRAFKKQFGRSPKELTFP